MAFPTTPFDSADKIPEGFREHYEEHTDGKFYPKFDGVPPGFVPRDKFDGSVKASKAVQRQLEDARSELEKFRDIDDPAKARAALQRVQELEGKELLDRGQFTQALQHQTDAIHKEYKPKIDALTGRAETAEKRAERFQQRIAARGLQDEVYALCKKQGVRERSYEDVLNAAEKDFGYEIGDDDQGQVAPRGGKVDTKGLPLTLAVWLDAKREERDWFEPSSGAGSRGNTTPLRANGKIRLAWDDRDGARRYQDEIAKGNVEFYHRQ